MEKLYENALKGYNNAYVPYSNFRVGAAVELNDGRIIYGCNVENASYGLCNCAERTTLFSTYAQGYRKKDIKRIMIIGNTKRPISPCGACRQVISELMDENCEVILTNLQKEYKVMKVKDLLPYRFIEDDLHE